MSFVINLLYLLQYSRQWLLLCVVEERREQGWKRRRMEWRAVRGPKLSGQATSSTAPAVQSQEHTVLDTNKYMMELSKEHTTACCISWPTRTSADFGLCHSRSFTSERNLLPWVSSFFFFFFFFCSVCFLSSVSVSPLISRVYFWFHGWIVLQWFIVGHCVD